MILVWMLSCSRGRTEKLGYVAISAGKLWTTTTTGDGMDKLAVFRNNRPGIEEEARRKYLAGRTEPDGSVRICTGDLRFLLGKRAVAYSSLGVYPNLLSHYWTT